jgi:phosphopantothenoylcysteine decarboxylase/phosphopantothenate--cysteine ligase
MPDIRRVLLIIGGGIAAYKSLELIRRLSEHGIKSRVILTDAATHFVTPLSLAALSGDRVYQSLFDLTDETEMGHIQLSRSADLVVVAPATAHLMARMAQGLADDLATTTLLATDKPVLIAPAMNVRMWRHKATQRNLAQLLADGIQVIGPNDGDMACGEFGPGRMAEPAEILSRILSLLNGARDLPLSGRRAIVTAGPTHEPIDPVRYIANRSSGRQGYAVAQALADLGAKVHLISGPVSLGPPPGVQVTQIETAQQMAAAVANALPADIAICAAAVADWRVKDEGRQKIKKTSSGPPSLDLVENPDILAELSRPGPQRPSLVIGFAAETHDVLAHATAKRLKKGCDWIIANDVSPSTGIMGGADNTITLITPTGAEAWESMPKDQVARALASRIAAHFSGISDE